MWRYQVPNRARSDIHARYAPISVIPKFLKSTSILYYIPIDQTLNASKMKIRDIRAENDSSVYRVMYWTKLLASVATEEKQSNEIKWVPEVVPD